jgi:hypothetical protein
MEVSGGKTSTRISLDISPLLFHTVSKLVQALVITYVYVFQDLAVEGDVLLPKPFLNVGFNVIVRWKPLASKMFLQRTNVTVQGAVSGLCGG